MLSRVFNMLKHLRADRVDGNPKIQMKPDKIIVGLGNPGAQYRDTRHNVGFMAIAELVSRFALGSPRRQFHAETWELRIGAINALLVAPTTFMNLSGTAVAEAVRFYKLDPKADLCVLCDDLDLPVARLRIRESASSGGQKGLKDIIAKLGTQDFARIRIGIGRPLGSREVVDHVLTTFSKDERIDVDLAIKNAADAVLVWAERGAQEAMNKFNVREKTLKKAADARRSSDDSQT